MRLVHAYGNESQEKKHYVQLLRQNQASLKHQVVLASFSLGFIYMLIYLFYAYSLYIGGKFRVEDVTDYNNQKVYTGGQVITVMMCLILGSFDLGTVISHYKKLKQAKKTGQVLLTVINQDDGKRPGSDSVPHDSFKGSIKFNRVDFHYPSNKKKIISDFTCEFEANKSTALFGVKCGKSTLLKILM